MSSTGTGKRVDEAILKLADRLSQNTGVKHWLQSTVQESAKPSIAFCQWMGLEMSKLDDELWTGFMHETFDLVTCSSRPSNWHLLLLRLCSNHQCSHSHINLPCIPLAYLRCRHPHSCSR